MSEIYHTPQEAIDVVMAQPEMAAVQRLAEDGSPHPDGRRLNADTTEDRPPAVTPRHRSVALEVFHLAGIDFARQQNAAGLIRYTALLSDDCTGPQPRALNMTVMRTDAGWRVAVFGTYGAQLLSIHFPAGKRDDIERVARKALETYAARANHRKRTERQWRINKAIRRQAAEGTDASPGGPGCPGCPGEEARS